ncbi:hypothetical protein CK231_12870 [Mesorhizobium loti]|nr:hypothetical protein CK231_12870 [Mesorhizobium loti]PBB56311.1 hypothetical protein CK223_09450 [Mesorhizobium loti]PBB62061.1 hypothetical protein CK217_11120 [Mesorhizobium loti]PBC17489.1 hypothetical protein CK225_05830 [Mesorhizobium loti]QGX79590.1 hypothetical protein EB234_24005 [Mesorhizobium japonicum R7A]
MGSNPILSATQALRASNHINQAIDFGQAHLPVALKAQLELYLKAAWGKAFASKRFWRTERP